MKTLIFAVLLTASTGVREAAEWIEVLIPQSWPKTYVRHVLRGCDERHWKVGDTALINREGCIVRPWDPVTNAIAWPVTSVGHINRWRDQK